MIVIKSKAIVLLLTCLIVFSAFLLGCKKDTGGSSRNNGPRNTDTLPRTNDTLPGPRRPPVANAGADQTVTILNQASFAKLNGMASLDSGGTPLKYLWRQLTGPGPLFIQNTESVETSIGPHNSGPADYNFELKVYNGNGSDLDTVKISFENPSYCPTNRSEILVSLTFLAELPGNVSIPEMYAVGNKLIFTSWFDNQSGATSNTIYIYDRLTGSWITTHASVARTAVSTVVAGNKIFFAGGSINNFDTDVVDIYDITTNSWTTTQLSEAKSDISGVLHENKIYFAGGYKYQHQAVSKKIDIYHLQTNTWSTTELPTIGRARITAVAVLDKIMFAGGYWVDGYYYEWPSPIINIYNTASNTWSFDTMTIHKAEFAAIGVNNNVYFAGGLFNDAETAHVESWNWATSNRSNSCLSQPMALYHSNCAVTKNDKILFYPLKHTGAGRNKIDIFNWLTNTWSIGVLPLNLIPDDKGRAMAVSGQEVFIVIGNKLYRMNI